MFMDNALERIDKSIFGSVRACLALEMHLSSLLPYAALIRKPFCPYYRRHVEGMCPSARTESLSF